MTAPPRRRGTLGVVRRPRAALDYRFAVLAVLAVLVILVLLHHGSSPPPATTAPVPGVGSTTTTLPATTTTSPVSGPTTTAPPSDRLPSQSAYPAYAHMPYTGPGFQVTVTGAAPGGRLAVEVFSPTLSVTDERALFAAFLARYHDDGSHYVVDYVTLAGAPPVATPTTSSAAQSG